MKKGENKTEWRLVNPEPLMQAKGTPVNQHPKRLSGKTVVLYWNGKPNGDLFLSRIGELLVEKVDHVEVIKAWEALPLTKRTDPTAEASRITAKRLSGLNPDLTIGAPGD